MFFSFLRLIIFTSIVLLSIGCKLTTNTSQNNNDQRINERDRIQRELDDLIKEGRTQDEKFKRLKKMLDDEKVRTDNDRLKQREREQKNEEERVKKEQELEIKKEERRLKNEKETRALLEKTQRSLEIQSYWQRDFDNVPLEKEEMPEFEKNLEGLFGEIAEGGKGDFFKNNFLKGLTIKLSKNKFDIKFVGEKPPSLVFEPSGEGEKLVLNFSEQISDMVARTLKTVASLYDAKILATENGIQKTAFYLLAERGNIEEMKELLSDKNFLQLLKKSHKNVDFSFVTNEEIKNLLLSNNVGAYKNREATIKDSLSKAASLADFESIVKDAKSFEIDLAIIKDHDGNNIVSRFFMNDALTNNDSLKFVFDVISKGKLYEEKNSNNRSAVDILVERFQKNNNDIGMRNLLIGLVKNNVLRKDFNSLFTEYFNFVRNSKISKEIIELAEQIDETSLRNQLGADLKNGLNALKSIVKNKMPDNTDVANLLNISLDTLKKDLENAKITFDKNEKQKKEIDDIIKNKFKINDRRSVTPVELSNTFKLFENINAEDSHIEAVLEVLTQFMESQQQITKEATNNVYLKNLINNFSIVATDDELNFKFTDIQFKIPKILRLKIIKFFAENYPNKKIIDEENSTLTAFQWLVKHDKFDEVGTLVKNARFKMNFKPENNAIDKDTLSENMKKALQSGAKTKKLVN